jgi:amino acid adenylation domain-containing protein
MDFRTKHSSNLSGKDAASIIELLQDRAARTPGRVAYTFLTDRETESSEMTYGELDSLARSIAAELQQAGGKGELALLLFPNAIEFIAAFLGCLYAGMVAVPAYPPRKNRGLTRLSSIAADAQPGLVLTTASLLPVIQPWAAQIPNRKDIRVLATDLAANNAAESWRAPDISRDTLAFLQYTSGSTATPKGVMVSHGNIMANEEMIRRAFDQSESSVIVSWLPLYHDMGLIGGVLQPLYLGASCILMSSVAFLQKPRRWLELITRYRATTSGGPNFAYDLCVRKIPVAERDGLDLSSWTVAFNGAEPVRPETMERFSQAFAPCGFRRRAFYPCYGLAESTLFVTGGIAESEPRLEIVSSTELQQSRVIRSSSEDQKSLVSCGQSWMDQQVIIVDPESRRPCAPDKIGEIWVAGPSVAQGYWNRPQETGRDFHAHLHDEAGENKGISYLRTGDLGFIQDDHLFVTGRLKDLIIIRGRNHYPQDIEYTVEQSHPSLRPGCGAALSILIENDERIVIVQEVDRRPLETNLEAIIAAIRAAVAQEHEILLHDVVLIRVGSIPKTSSGKIQRHACRESYLKDQLAVVARSVAEATTILDDAKDAVDLIRAELFLLDRDDRRKQLESFLEDRAARILHLSRSRLDAQQSLIALGMDSLAAVELKHVVEERLGISISLTALLDGASLCQVVDHVLEELEHTHSAPEKSLPVSTPMSEFPLSYGQRGLWFVQRLAPESAAYHITVAARVVGNLNLQAFKQAFQTITDRHAALRTTFHQSPSGEPVQRIHESVDVDFTTIDAEDWDEEKLTRRLCQEACKAFDLERGPLLRVSLLKRSAQEHAIEMTVHHLVADFWSLVIVFDELTRLYLQAVANVPANLEPLQARYSDFVAWEQTRLSGERGERLWNYWREILSPPLTALDLPTDWPRLAVQTYRGASRALTLDVDLTTSLQALSRAQGSSLFVLLLAAFKTMLHRYTGQTDLMVGCPVAGRSLPQLDNLAGYFVNPLVLRTDASGDPIFEHLVERVRRATLEALDHQDYSFALMVEQLNIARDPGRTPLFQVMFALQKSQRTGQEALSSFALGESGAEIKMGNLSLRSLSLPEKQVPFDLTLMMAERETDLIASLQYNRDLFDDETAERMMEQFRVLLSAVAANPRQPISSVSLLTPTERDNLLLKWNSTRADFDSDCLIHDLFEAQAECTPNAIAVISEGDALSYIELESRANKLAHRLQRSGIRPGSIVGLYVERDLNLVVSILGILKAGAAYLPLDPSHPQERIKLILQNARVSLVLTTAQLQALLPSYDGRLLLLDKEWEAISQESAARASKAASPDHTAYLLYTSGSTGHPKGVAVPHQAVVNFLTSMAQKPGLIAEDIFVSVTTPSFDIFGLELYLPLMVGAKLILPSRETTADGAKLLETLKTHRATAMQATPATWRLLLAAGWNGEPEFKLLCGGEALPWDLASDLRVRASSTWNLYGPTETTIWSSIYELAAEEEQAGCVPIGRPIGNTRLYVIDANLQATPLGVPGELFIGGTGLAHGYWDLPMLTAEKFVPDHISGESGARLYRTGDRVRWRRDGVLEFFGRFDNQVKVRGFRIELGEVEAALASYPGVRQAVAIAQSDSHGSQQVVGYIVPDKADGHEPLEAGKLRSFLLERLPEPFVPSLFVTLNSLPLTPNGKLDRKALPKPEFQRSHSTAQAIAPRSEVERAIADIWKHTLHIEKVGLNDNFFDLGGHSLLLAQVQSRLSDIGHKVSMLDLLRHSTIAALAEHLGHGDASSGAVLEGYQRGSARRASPDRSHRQIAIIGMAGRFPGARNIDDLWHRLCSGDECITLFSDEELAELGISSDVLNDRNYVKAGGILEGAELFDAAFFGFHPREAEMMDPQHRVFLECAWHALEDAGYNSANYQGRIGIFAGAGLNTYLYQAGHALSNSSALRYQAFIGNDKDFVTTRVSYKLNLRGPSVNVQTACSTSLVAVHLSCQSLLDGDCDIALAGGVAIRAPQKQGYFYEEGGILSPDAHCRAFDKDAAGTVFGNGVGIVVLKPLEKAVADGDTIYAVIKGSAINNDGGAKIGYTAPSVDGQAGVISEAFSVAGVNPETISYIETHGTGTPLGDPIEVAALREAFRSSAANKHTCAIGSVKTNLGHLDTAAGITGLIKTVCALRHSLLPPSINFTEPNPKIDFESSPFYVNTELTEWRTNGNPRRAGVSSFGIGGTNAHVVLEEAPPALPSGSSRPWQLLMLSAKTSSALQKMTSNLAEYFKTSGELNLADVSFTTQVGRQVFAHRRVALCEDSGDAITVLESLEPDRLIVGVREGGSPSVAFLFAGQGTQYVNMARELYETEPDFAREVDGCVELLKPHIHLDLRDILFPQETSKESAARQLERTEFAQPALFIIEYALARLWMSWGVTPQAMMGHSVGEYVAACLAGVLSLEDALRLVTIRGRLMQSLPGGAMLAVQLSGEELKHILGDDLSLAAINGPAACVISGTDEAIAALEKRLSEQGVAHTRLRTSHAFHSPMMDPILDEFTAHVKQCSLQAPRVPYVSNLTGTWITASEATDPLYWVRHLRETVRLSEGIKALLEEPDPVLIEIGPGRTLSTLARQQEKNAVAIPSLPHARDEQSGVASLLKAVGRAWVAGVDIDWQSFYAREHRRRVPLPTYPFEGEYFWIKGRQESGRNEKAALDDWFYVPAWRRSVLPFSDDRRDALSPWLVLESDQRFSSHLAEHLRSRGLEVITARMGEQFARLTENRYVMNPRRREDYDALLKELRKSGRFPEGVIHAWNITAVEHELDHVEDWTDARCRSFDSLVFLAQALERANPEAPARFVVLSNNMQKVCGEQAIYPEKSLLLGPVKVIPQEHPNLSCQSIDLMLAKQGGADEEGMVRDLFDEITGPIRDRVIAYRGGERWVQTFDQLRMDSDSKVAPRLRDGGVYVITGGTGGIGLTLAEEIARSVKAKLVLIGRSALPERERWSDWIVASGGQDRWSLAIQKIKLLEEMGSEVLTLNADVSDAHAMATAIHSCEERFGSINGVIHAAGIAGGGIIQLKTPDVAEQVLNPKVHGTLVLQSALRGHNLDFFMLCSSITSIIGGFGQADYCAANAFCDAFAQSNFHHRGPYIVSVNWDRWNEVGMAVRNSEAYGGESLLATSNTRVAGSGSAHQHPLLGASLVEAPDRAVFISRFSLEGQWVLSEHRVANLPTVPGTTYLEMARAAFARLSTDQPVEIHDVTFRMPLVVEEGEAREVVTLLDQNSKGYSFRVLSRIEGPADDAQRWEEHARGEISAGEVSEDGKAKNNDVLTRMLDRGQRLAVGAPRTGEGGELASFITTGPRWQSLKEVYVDGDEALAVLELDDRFSEDMALYELHPSLLDTATGFIQFLVEGDYLPLVYEHLTIRAPIATKVFSHIRFHGDARERREVITCDVSIFSENGVEAVNIKGFSMRRVTEASLPRHELKPRLVDASAQAAFDRARTTNLSDGIDPQKGAEVFRRVLSGGTSPQIIISTRDINEAMRAAQSLTRARLLEEFESIDSTQTAHARPPVSSVYTEPTSEIERRIATVWQRVLGIEQVGINDNFFELGGTSLTGIQVVSELKKEFKRDIPAVSIFEASTVAALARYLGRNDNEAEVFERVQDRADKKKRALGNQQRMASRRNL